MVDGPQPNAQIAAIAQQSGLWGTSPSVALGNGSDFIGGASAAGTPQTLGVEVTSGASLQTTPGQTTTILGRYTPDMQNVIEGLQYPQTLDFGPNPNGFNVLNVPQDVAAPLTADQFWNSYNRPFLDEAWTRGDAIVAATNPEGASLSNATGLTGFGREAQYLTDNLNARYNSFTRQWYPSTEENVPIAQGNAEAVGTGVMFAGTVPMAYMQQYMISNGSEGQQIGAGLANQTLAYCGLNPGWMVTQNTATVPFFQGQNAFKNGAQADQNSFINCYNFANATGGQFGQAGVGQARGYMQAQLQYLVMFPGQLTKRTANADR